MTAAVQELGSLGADIHSSLLMACLLEASTRGPDWVVRGTPSGRVRPLQYVSRGPDVMVLLTISKFDRVLYKKALTFNLTILRKTSPR